MKYDDATWHSDGDFPNDLPAEAGATHAGMFLVWALLHDLGGEFHDDSCAEAFADLKGRRITPGQYFLTQCDGKLTDEDFNETGNAFARTYFDLESGGYLADYEKTLCGALPTAYHVKDSWENYDCLRPVLDRRFADWQRPPSFFDKIFRFFGRS